jgi:hypothetical protein
VVTEGCRPALVRVISGAVVGLFIGASLVWGFARNEAGQLGQALDDLRDNHRETELALTAAEGRADDLAVAAGRTARLSTAIETIVADITDGGHDTLDTLDRALVLLERLEGALYDEGFLD